MTAIEITPDKAGPCLVKGHGDHYRVMTPHGPVCPQTPAAKQHAERQAANRRAEAVAHLQPENGYVYPSTVPWSAIERFLTEIGVEPVDRDTLMEINLSPYGLRVTRQRRNVENHAYVTGKGAGADVAKQVTTARIEWEA